MGAQTAGMVSAFRVFRTDLRDAFADYSGSLVNIDVLLTWGAARFAAVQALTATGTGTHQCMYFGFLPLIAAK